MMKLITGMMLAVMLSVQPMPAAAEDEVAQDYLLGRWAVDAKDCSASASELVVFKPNGTFEVSRLGKTEVTGFWLLKGDMLTLHLVTTPAHYKDIYAELEAYDGIYQYYQARLVLVETEKTGFKAVGVLGDEIRKAVVKRCP
jgi:hypothetical protein